jgi:hypothetical protein
MWTVKFSPFIGKQTVGDLVAIWAAGTTDEFVFQGTANLDIQGTVDEFVAQAKKALAAAIDSKDPGKDPTVLLVQAVEESLNG